MKQKRVVLGGVAGAWIKVEEIRGCLEKVVGAWIKRLSGVLGELCTLICSPGPAS